MASALIQTPKFNVHLLWDIRVEAFSHSIGAEGTLPAGKVLQTV